MSLKSPIAPAESESITTLIPARVDRMHWSRFHTRMVLAAVVAESDGLCQAGADKLDAVLAAVERSGGTWGT